MKEKILVTGSAGFIGSYLCKSLIIDGYDVLGIDNLYDIDSNQIKENRLKKQMDKLTSIYEQEIETIRNQHSRM